MAQKKISELQLISSVTDTLMIPTDNGLQSYRATALQFKNHVLSSEIIGQWALPNRVGNGQFAVSVASSAATIALKTNAGTDPSATNPVYAFFDDGAGTITKRSITAALSVVIPSTATLGHPDGVEAPIYVYLVDNSGTISMAVSSVAKTLKPTTISAIGTGSDDSGIYGTALTTKPIALVGVWMSTQATAGTWASATGDKHFGVPWNWIPTFSSQNIIASATQLTQTADVWRNPEASPTLITLPPGVYDIGYDVSLFLARVSGTVGTYGVVAITTAAGTILDGTVANCFAALDATFSGTSFPCSRMVRITVTSAVQYKLMIRSNQTNTGATVQLMQTSWTTGLTDPDNHSVFYARRVG